MHHMTRLGHHKSITDTKGPPKIIRMSSRTHLISSFYRFICIPTSSLATKKPKKPIQVLVSYHHERFSSNIKLPLPSSQASLYRGGKMLAEQKRSKLPGAKSVTASMTAHWRSQPSRFPPCFLPNVAFQCPLQTLCICEYHQLTFTLFATSCIRDR